MKVLSFIPPAVEPLPPPMNINPMMKKAVAGSSAPVSIVLKPALRGVTAWNQAAHSLALQSGNPASVAGLLCSSTRITIIATMFIASVPTSISLV